MNKRAYNWIIALALLLSGSYSRAASNSQATEVLKHIEMKCGIAVACGLTDMSLPIGLAKQSDMHVYVVEDDAKMVAARRKEVDAAGLSALRVRVEPGPLKALAYPNFVANVVIVAGLPKTEQMQEYQRILRPRGFLILLPSKSSKALAEKDVAPLLAQNGNKGWLPPRQCGSAVAVQSKKREGAAEWTHYYRDPDNNRYSPDKLVKVPLRLLWYGEPVAPLGDLFLTQGLSAGGRLFLTDVFPEDTTRARLTCLDAYNGIQLWKRVAGGPRYEKPVSTARKDKSLRILRLPGYVQPGEIAVSDERVYLTDGPELLIMDARTGKDLKRFKAPAPTHAANCWRFVAYQGDVLFGYANAPTPIPKKPPAPKVESGPPTLFSLHRDTGALRWIRGAAEGETLAPDFSRPLAIGEKRIIVRSGNSLHAIDPDNGKTVWKTEELPAKDAQTWWEGTIHRGKFLLAMFSIRSWGGKKRVCTRAYATEDGKAIEKLSPDLFGDMFFCSEQAFLGTPPRIRLGCNYGSGVGNIYFHRNQYYIGKPGTPVMRSGKRGSYGGFRAACKAGVIPANGLAHLLPNGLGCKCAPLRATVTYESVPATEATNAAFQPEPEQLADLDKSLEKPAATTDWPTYLGDNVRSGATRQDVSQPRTLKWEARVKGTPTPCIAAAGKVFFGSTDECIYALNAGDGAVAWKYQTTGAIPSTPVFWKGRVIAGSNDGSLYALSAQDGKLLWRMRCGPSVRKQVAFERLSSPWPIQQGLVVDDKSLFFTAGCIPGQGIHAFAADPRTGKVAWKIPVAGGSTIPCGYMLGKAGNIMLPATRSASIWKPPAERGKATVVAALRGDFTEARWVEGCESDAAAFRDGFVVHGGCDYPQRGYRAGAGYCGNARIRSGPYSLTPAAKKKLDPKTKPGSIGDGGSFLPIFASGRVFLRHRGTLVAIAREDLFKFAVRRKQKGGSPGSLLKWSAKDLPCGNAEWLVAGLGAGEKDPATLLAGGTKGVSAINATDGKVLWSVALEGSSLPPAVADGRIYVTSPDGHVRALAKK